MGAKIRKVCGLDFGEIMLWPKPHAVKPCAAPGRAKRANAMTKGAKELGKARVFLQKSDDLGAASPLAFWTDRLP
jgi:hypothetical protein